MHKCSNCGMLFEKPRMIGVTYECHGLHTGYDDVCPECGSENFYEVVQCMADGCEEYASRDELEYGVCKACSNEARKHFRIMYGKLEPWEQNFLEDYADGLRLEDITEDVEDA